MAADFTSPPPAFRPLSLPRRRCLWAAVVCCLFTVGISSHGQTPEDATGGSESSVAQPSDEHHSAAHHGQGDHPQAHHPGHAADSSESYSSHRVHHDFSDAERWAAIFDDPERHSWQLPEELVDLMAIVDGQTVADLGAGTGFLLPYLASATPHGKVLALDPEANLVEHMRQRAEEAGLEQVEVRQIPYDDPQLTPASVDRIVIVNTWHHIEQRESYAAKLLAGLGPEGRLFIVDFTMDSPSGPPKEHRLAPEEVMRELEAGGFDSQLIEEPLPRQYIVVGKRR